MVGTISIKWPKTSNTPSQKRFTFVIQSSVKFFQVIEGNHIIPFEGGKQRQMPNFKSSSLSNTVQMVGEGLTAVGNRLQSFVIPEESLKVEVLDRQILDMLGVLIDQEVAVLSQDSNGVLVC